MGKILFQNKVQAQSRYYLYPLSLENYSIRVLRSGIPIGIGL